MHNIYGLITLVRAGIKSKRQAFVCYDDTYTEISVMGKILHNT